ncbi:murein hydrolase activator EnvC [Planococcus sp. 107-1]|uniref:murein hydrolase activator EnvC family protein n=1 Tax=Planococcus sp. 107-1 TaxID=2908840 RepID=UPI001F29F673|nr:peptidoglycan DD-metalloendopeptidase family protein [Planococcus sp. 107-1]UJF25509.1 peptidoglycan DD-metalloendopeptidase family protein [Planococcus sp. 107-1]
MNLKSKWMLTGLSSVLALSILVPTASADKLSELEQKKQEIEQRQSELNSGIQEKTSEITENQSSLEKIMAKITELNNKIQETEGKINAVQAEIDQTKVEIDELKVSIEELERKIAERTELLQERARAIQLSGGSVDYIDVLLGASSFIDFIDRFSAVNTLIEADREIMREQAEDKQLLAEQKAEVETKLAEQEERLAELETLKASLDDQKTEKAGFVKELQAEQERLASEKSILEEQRTEAIDISAELETQIMNEQKRLAEVARKAEEARQRKLAAEKAAQEKAAAEQKAKAAKANVAKTPRVKTANGKKSANTNSSVKSYQAPATSMGSPFIRPTTGRNTSNFGWRDIGDGPEFTAGMDIANVPGTEVKAAADGYVSSARVMGGLGNAVVITHSVNGQTMTTVYGHLNSIDVSVGQKVSQGQRIGGMGNTGRSTGPHLHFETHIGIWNGSSSNAVDPRNYIGS